ncbi:MAG: hypothetical protein ACI4UN_01310, partial [Muribaculaceae bacterium]
TNTNQIFQQLFFKKISKNPQTTPQLTPNQPLTPSEFLCYKTYFFHPAATNKEKELLFIKKSTPAGTKEDSFSTTVKALLTPVSVCLSLLLSSMLKSALPLLHFLRSFHKSGNAKISVNIMHTYDYYMVATEGYYTLIIRN